MDIVVVVLVGILGLCWLIFSCFIQPRLTSRCVHYATWAYTLCGRYIIGLSGGYVIQHTTIEENVTCKKCLRKLNA